MSILVSSPRCLPPISASSGALFLSGRITVKLNAPVEHQGRETSGLTFQGLLSFFLPLALCPLPVLSWNVTCEAQLYGDAEEGVS